LADLGASITTAEPNELQKVLEAFDVEERLSLTLSLLHKEIEILKLQRDISKQVEAKMTKVKYFLCF
jgi:Lon-like ATP-dependent protease